MNALLPASNALRALTTPAPALCAPTWRLYEIRRLLTSLGTRSLPATPEDSTPAGKRNGDQWPQQR
jgi:hypothetical protein